MGQEDEIKLIKIAPKEAEILKKEDLHKYGRIIKEFSYELSSINASLIMDSEKFLIILIQKLGINKTKKVVKNLTSNVYEYLLSLYERDNGKMLIIALNEIKELSYIRIIELFNILNALEIKDVEGIKILSKVTTLLIGLDSLSKAAELQDNYVKDIIYNRPHFSLQSKVNSILNASKSSEGTHIIKYGNLFLNTEKDGNITSEANKGTGESRALGLFADDMRFVDQYELKILNKYAQELPHKLNFSENHNFWSHDELNYGDYAIAKRRRTINGAFFEKLELVNSGHESLKANLILSSLIKDIFEVRGKICRDNPPVRIECDQEGNVIISTTLESNTYGVKVRLVENDSLIFPEYVDEVSAKLIYQIDLQPNQARNICIMILPLLNSQAYVDGEITLDPPASYDEAMALIENAKKTEFSAIKIDGDIPNIQKTIDKSLKDLNMLVNYINIDGKSYSYISAGLPRYAALFGRDSLTTALQVFPLNNDIARDTLELLAKFQGKDFDDRYIQELSDIQAANWPVCVKNAAIKGIKNYYVQREESPGKILHELRVGELANSGIIPHAPYYGTVDATPLWLILYGEYYKWTQDKDFLKKLLPNAEAALKWINSNISEGYLRFIGSMHSKVKIQNQGWKDAGDSIRHVLNVKGNLCDPDYPIALAEVQGYVYRAYILMSEIYNELGEYEKAENLMKQAIDLKARFNKDFWLNDEQFFTMALDRSNKPVLNVASNIGHCLSMGIIEDYKINMIEDKMISNDMYSGWGIRTLGCKCHAYDPISYHNGSVWVHDSAFVAAGLSEKSMAMIAKGLFEAANMFEGNRLPELFSGFQREDGDTFIENYPEACSPQAWASGSLIWLLIRLIGLQVKNQEVVLENSYIPEWLKSISIKGIKIGDKIINIKKVYKQV
ncbi:MAG: hypothetical protein A2287_08680 [Candidatus Melainabacteria bacterium RIFOXYA12_FULL_32_12]|nr:MAG: hypothetical protein A2255_01385 [Candidatus Melainabacteria bacterium RIFOXYA2_FULL_32_9]OGI30456.1 MAG: hypothetical protein A2287_08680 [Candidatus Melainabacteria bacterium RIFOXYA12_FULL_32_12]